MKLIGLSGTNGSGKDSVGHMLAERHGWLFVSGSEILREEVKERGLSIERENLRNVSAEWRRESGLGVLIDKAVEIYNVSDSEYKGLVIASLRNPGEADRVHELGGTVVWTDAEPEVRFERINKRMRGDEDRKTFAQFMAEEQAEMQRSGDAATLDMAGVKAKADVFIANNSNEIGYFREQADQSLKKVISL